MKKLISWAAGWIDLAQQILQTQPEIQVNEKN
jgi:hypothetical protein